MHDHRKIAMMVLLCLGLAGCASGQRPDTLASADRVSIQEAYQSSAESQGSVQSSVESRGIWQSSAEGQGTLLPSAESRGIWQSSAEGQGTLLPSAEDQGSVQSSAEDPGILWMSGEKSGILAWVIEAVGSLPGLAAGPGSSQGSGAAGGTGYEFTICFAGDINLDENWCTTQFMDQQPGASMTVFPGNWWM